MPGSIKKNYILNLINTITGIIFPLVTFPYVSRILLADGIGQVQFFDSIINYVILLTSLGIPLYAVRELARYRDDEKQRSLMASEILILHTGLTILGYLIVYILAMTIGQIRNDLPLFFLLSAGLLFNAIGVNWFYQAVEDFKYITVRALLIRILSTVALFVFVKSRSDILAYAAILVTATVGNNVFNFFRLRKYIRLDLCTWGELRIMRHLKPALHIFILNLIISVYVNLDSVMLGFLKDETAVGYYTGAVRITKTLLGIIAALGTVLLPRFSNLINKGRQEEFVQLGNKAISFVLAMALPISIGLILLAHPLILLFCGPHYEPSVLTLQIVAPIIAFIGLSGILGMQILYPQGQENKVIFATLAGAIINFTLNYILIPRYAQFGAAFATAVAEFTVMTMMFVVGRRYLPFDFLSRRNLNYIVAAVLMTLVVFPLTFLRIPDWGLLLVCTGVGAGVYLGYLFFRKDLFCLQVKSILLKK